MKDTIESRDSFERMARWIGDLDHPFYNDERQRWVWYEASAVATQIMLIGSYLTATIVLLALGSDALGPVMIMMAPILAGTLVFLGYVARRSAEYTPSSADLRSGRSRAVAVVMLAFVGAFGWTIMAGDQDRDLSSVLGLITGLAVGSALLYAAVRWTHKRNADDGHNDPADLD